tara:strand:+ start:1054 stop:1323 length:270 start_codon:yes stop_codon:yes gene_type:complete
MTVIELHGEMAGIVINPNSAEEEVRIIRAVEEAIKKINSVPGMFKVTERLWFQSEVKIPSSLFCQQIDMSRAGLEMLEDGGLVSSEGFE